MNENMTKQEFLKHFDDLIEEDEGTTQGDEKLAEMSAWDSLAVMGFIAMVDEQFNATVAPNELAKAQTVNDLAGLLGDRVEDK